MENTDKPIFLLVYESKLPLSLGERPQSRDSVFSPSISTVFHSRRIHFGGTSQDSLPVSYSKQFPLISS